MAEQISDNVGKKIVEALRMQNKSVESAQVEDENTIKESEAEILTDAKSEPTDKFDNTETQVQGSINFEHENNINIDVNSLMEDNIKPQINLDTVLQNTINENLGVINFNEEQKDIEYPNNVAILSHLISKLPAGVTKQTGAIIIKQTMEALGIPIKSVLKEAQQYQELLSSRARECQKNIIDYKKQISTLEIKTQQYQKQAVAMNNIINLFISTGI